MQASDRRQSLTVAFAGAAVWLLRLQPLVVRWCRLVLLRAAGRFAMRPPRPGSFLQLQSNQIFGFLVLLLKLIILLLLLLLRRQAVAGRVHLVQVLQRLWQEVLWKRRERVWINGRGGSCYASRTVVLDWGAEWTWIRGVTKFWKTYKVKDLSEQ